MTNQSTRDTETIFGIVRDHATREVLLTNGEGEILAKMHEVIFDRAPEEGFARLYFDHLNAQAATPRGPLGKVTL